MFEGEVAMNGVFGNISAFSVIGNNKLCGGIKPLRLPVCPRETETKGKNFPHKVIIAIAVVLFVVWFSICLFVIKQRANSSRKKEGIASPLDKKHPKLSYAELLHATDGFSSANLIGKGRYGSVYKGTLTSDSQKPIAVKVLDLQQRGAERTFKSECQVLKNLKHRNLVKVITSCSSIDFQGNDFKALVLEFMPNGSLETWLHPSSTELNHSMRLNLTQRLNIAIDVALALDYLHSQFGKPVVHCDLKPSNVLLDGDLTAYVSDFGLTKFLTMTAEYSIGEQSSSIGIRGTMGYIPPEYGLGKEVSTFGDVYSYGIVLMELFTGKRPTDSMFTGELSLRDYVKAALPDREGEIADPWFNFENEAFDQNGQSSGGGTGNAGKWLGSVLGIGVACSADSPIERMKIGDVLRELDNVRNRLIGDHRRRRA
ncbi:probable LRR receptor-like serine/threonine-protein kinase At3g47570 [Gossypium raimondii]|nr:probable LRR receptor-like serine/threonine-protein kinase At3g47570 [Gossypium raimondii]